jgi:phage-related baseplate assembly protein
MSNLPILPDLNFFNTDPQQEISDVKTAYEYKLNRDIQTGSPEYQFITTMAAPLSLLRQQFNAELKQNFLYYAKGEKLDHIGFMRDTPRLEKQGSTTNLRFTLSTVRPEAIIVPAGTRATADNTIFFATDEPLIINAGLMSGLVSATSLQTGELSNNIEVGEINTIVDPVPYVASVTNTDITLGGRDDESDDAYRERIYNAPSVFSVAGPRKAYEYITKQVSSAIGEVTVNSDSPATVQVYPLLTNGEIPNQAIIDDVQAALNENTVRPLGDRVTVLTPIVREYDLELQFFIYKDQAGNVDNLRNSVNQKVDEWVLWQRSKIGRDVNLSYLIRLVMETGIKRVSILKPTFTTIADNELAVNISKSVVFGGLEDE